MQCHLLEHTNTNPITVTLFVETGGRMVAWISPLVTSPLRLVVITMLYAANFAAVCRIFRQPKYRGEAQQSINVTTDTMLC